MICSQYSSVGSRQRAEIYAINAILREAEVQKFNGFISSRNCTPMTSRDTFCEGDSDSENSCFENRCSSKNPVSKSCKGRSLSTATALARTYRAQTASYKASKRKGADSFGAV